MSDQVRHEDTDTPTATDDNVRTLYKDTPTGDGDTAKQGVGVSPLPVDSEGADDPKSAGTPVHPRPTDDPSGS